MGSTDYSKKIIKVNFKRENSYDANAERELNAIGQRISEARTAKKLSLAALSEQLATMGVQISTPAIHKWESGKSVPNAYQLLAIAKALECEDSLSYFSSQSAELNVEGMQKVQSYKNDLIASGNYKPQPIKAKTKMKHIEMDVSNLPASAGTGAFLDSDSFEKISFPENSVPENAEFGIRVSGDSMEPVYHDGQIVWVQQCSELAIGEVGIFIYDGDGYIKAYDEQEPDESLLDEFTDSDGCVKMQPVLISYNEEYEPRVVSPHAEFKIVGRVLKS